ncbi:MAG: efflux RND transporter periplasmic adaptor subunit [Candidatus Nitrospinota bacterium M3_3B_026]
MYSMRLPVILVVIIALAAGPAPSFAQAGNGGAPPAPVEVAPVIQKDVSTSVELVGTVHPGAEAMVSAEAPGRVISFSKIEGDKVKEGEPVVSLDDTLYRIEVNTARGALQKAQAALEKARLAEERARELYKQKVASEEAMQNAALEVKAAKAEVALRKADLARAEHNLSRLKVRAPFDGWISRKLVEAGEWVKEGDGLYEIINLDRVDVIVEAPEVNIESFTRGKKTGFTLDAHPGAAYEGRIRAVSPKADAKTRTFMTRIGVDNRKGDILAGMVARVNIPAGEPEKTIMIPRDAVVWMARKPVVFTVDGDGRAKAVPVRLGRQRGELVEARGDLREGLPLVVTGNEILRDGQPVDVVGERSYD